MSDLCFGCYVFLKKVTFNAAKLQLIYLYKWTPIKDAVKSIQQN